MDTLRSNFLGEVLTANDDGYDEARKIWNGHIDRRPSLPLHRRGRRHRRRALRPRP